MRWLTDIRRVARVAFLAAVPAVLGALWSSTRQAFDARFSKDDLAWVLPLLALAYFLTALPVAFLFALYRDQATLHISRPLRKVALASALVFAGVTIIQIVGWVESTGSYLEAMSMIDWATGGAAVRDAQGDPRTLDFLSQLVGVLSDGAIALLLIAFFRAPEDEVASGIAPSRLLRIVTRVGAYCGVHRPGSLCSGSALRGVLYPPYLC
jgi:hypothetical protein